MKIIYVDIDTLRPDHLGCYGYHRNTSPNIDKICSDGVRFNQCYVPDAPCLPSRAALHHGRFGIHNGAVNHGGEYAEPYREGITRQFRTSEGYTHWVQAIQDAGYKTTSVSSFAGRHSSWWFLAGFNEVYDCGAGGMELATDVTGKALEFIEKNKDEENWFFHFNIWDPHTPYRTPDEYGNPFENDPVPSWITQELIDKQNESYGPHSANEALGEHNPKGRTWTDEPITKREVRKIENLNDYKTWIDGYDVGIRYADDAVGKVVEKLQELGIYDDCAIIISSDHGENQGELNVYGDHQTADLITNRVPMIFKWPGVKAGEYKGFHYQFDIAATVLQLLGKEVPSKWDGIGFKDALSMGKESSRDFVVVSQVPWSCQRAVIFGDYILIKTYSGGLKEFPELMLFNRIEDPHELNDLASKMPDKVNEGLALLQEWFDEQMAKADIKEDPMVKVIQEGGPFHTRGNLENYVEYYNKIGKPHIGERMKKDYEGIYGYSKTYWNQIKK